jgi:glutathione S-transferase
MKLLGVCLSPYVRKAAVVINLKGLDCEREDSFPGSLPRELSPLGKIPALVDGAVAIADSSVICEYLEEQYPAVPTLPKAVADRARARWLEEFSDSKLGELCGAGMFFERVVKKMLRGENADEAKVQDVINNQLPPVLDYLESQLPAEGFLFGAPGVADIAIATHFVNAAYAGYTVDASRWLRTAAFIERVRALPAVQRQLAAEAALMGQMAGR